MQKRNLTELLEVIISKIPAKYEGFRRMLEHERLDSMYDPPELMDSWHDVFDIINLYIKPPLVKDWEIEVIDLWTAKKDYRDERI
jgi:hypothetical protein